MSTFLSGYRRLNDVIAHVLLTFSGGIFAFAVLCSFGGAVERYTTGHSYAWMNDLPAYLVPWAIFPAMAVVARMDRHITVDMLPTFLKGRSRLVLQVAIQSIMLVTAIWFLHGGISALRFFIPLAQTADVGFHLPMPLIYLAFPTGFLLLANFALEGLLHAIDALLRGESPAGGPNPVPEAFE